MSNFLSLALTYSRCPSWRQVVSIFPHWLCRACYPPRTDEYFPSFCDYWFLCSCPCSGWMVHASLCWALTNTCCGARGTLLLRILWSRYIWFVAVVVVFSYTDYVKRPWFYLAVNVVYPFFSVFTLSYSVLLIKVLHCSVNELLEQPSVDGHIFISFFQRSLKPLLLFWSLLCQWK